MTELWSASGWGVGRAPHANVAEACASQSVGTAAPTFDHVGVLTKNAIYGTDR